MKRFMLVAALLIGGVAASLAMPDTAEARPRGYYYGNGYNRSYYGQRYYAPPRAYYRSYYGSPYYGNRYYGNGYYGNRYYGNRYYGGNGVIIQGRRGGVSIGF